MWPGMSQPKGIKIVAVVLLVAILLLLVSGLVLF